MICLILGSSSTPKIGLIFNFVCLRFFGYSFVIFGPQREKQSITMMPVEGNPTPQNQEISAEEEEEEEVSVSLLSMGKYSKELKNNTAREAFIEMEEKIQIRNKEISIGFHLHFIFISFFPSFLHSLF